MKNLSEGHLPGQNQSQEYRGKRYGVITAHLESVYL